MEKKINRFIKWDKKEFSHIVEKYAFLCNEMIGTNLSKALSKSSA